MVRQDLSVDERRRRNREYQRKRREKVYSDPELKEEYLRKERQSWKMRVEEGKIKTIANLSEREKRSKRKAWKRRQQVSRQRKRKAEHPETPPDSPVDSVNMQEPVRSRQSIAGERQKKKTRARYSREMKTLKNKLKKITKERDKLKKRWQREKTRHKKRKESPRKKTEQMLRGSKLKNSSIKKTLLFHNCLIEEFNKNKNNLQFPHKSAQKSNNLTLSGRVLKKYRLMHQTKQFGLTYNTLRKRRTADKKPTYIHKITQVVQDFYHNASRMTTDKQDTITRKKVKHQRMILTDTIFNLHREFIRKEPTVKISYSSFCALRPFYMTAPKPSDRKTCQCQYHENAKLMLEVLRTHSIIKSSKLEDSFELVCCSQMSEACLLRSCTRCLQKQTVPTPEQEQTKVEWQQWERVQDQTTDKLHYNTRLVKHTGTLAELIKLYQDKLKSETTTHVCVVQNQSREYRNMIKNCNESTVIVHVDFSEAWKCKYSSEVQSCHFGQNLPQLNLHTGIYYTKEQKSGFCTVSESKRQDAAAIWTYMEPVLRDIRSKFPNATTIHFWSDGPSKQYKNKKNFALICSVPHALGFQRTTWNFFATSHGKGAPDGVGGTVKRTADRLVLQGNSIEDGKMFHDMVGRSLSTTQVYQISEGDMHKYDALLSQPLKPIPATRKIHQVIPHRNSIQCRPMSCFCCEMCKCFNVTTFQVTEDTPAREPAQENGGFTVTQKNRGPLAMLMEEMEEEPCHGPDGTVTDVSASAINSGDWLAVIYDQNWWLAKAIAVDGHHQDVQVEFFHPHGPSTRFHPKSKKDQCFIPLDNILVKLLGPSTPGRASRTRDIYQLSDEVMDFIEEAHINRLLPDKL